MCSGVLVKAKSDFCFVSNLGDLLGWQQIVKTSVDSFRWYKTEM